MFEVRRADRCCSRWGIEKRVPFLDTEFIKAYWSHSAETRHPSYGGIEKFLLRDAFSRDNLLPSDVLWRSKEAFSDGVSSKEKSWFNILQDYINTQVTVSHNEPTNEAYYYKKVFIELFGEERVDVLPGYWQPKWIDKKGTVPSAYVDPSARTLDIYS
jgi:asparagine synthase (glutamine-hydrolysing)